MEPWWFLMPLFYTAFVILLIGGIIALIVDKATDGQGFAAPIIAMISTIPLVITMLLAALWLVVWIFWVIWSPFI